MRTVRSLAGVLALGALPLVLSACSSSSDPAASAAAPSAASSAAPASTAPADPDAGLPTGSQLKATLVSTGIPAGYAIDDSGSVDTGPMYQEPSPDTTAKPTCANLDGTSWIELAGYNPVSFAENDYIDKDASEEFTQEVDAYRGTTAQDVMTALSKLTNTCAHFTDTDNKSTVKVSVRTGTSLGDGDVVITLSDPTWQSDETLEAVRVGHSVVSVMSTDNNDSAAFAAKLAAEISAKVKALG